MKTTGLHGDRVWQSLLPLGPRPGTAPVVCKTYRTLRSQTLRDGTFSTAFYGASLVMLPNHADCNAEYGVK